MTNAEPVDESTGAPDPGMVRAGAAAAARRRELDISQRSLAAEGVINAGALIAFEKGRSWPRERTRARLEEILQWPPGTIARLRQGEQVQPSAPPPQAPVSTSSDEASLIAQAVITAVGAFGSTVAALPPDDDDAFLPRVTAILSDLRQLEAVASRAARIGRVTPPLIKALSTVRGLYDDLMVRAAKTPHATLGHRLYAARRGANLTVFETAQAAGVSEQTIQQVEAGEPVSAADSDAIETLVRQIA
ncbi:transcriptional regulator with XRE-family HTH domain [Mycolicibacterium iranicum]|uniref:Transcriptional regulator with XRE-family HTH domain n=1 Tax=Mycolicibacterium iranicum TaxID=912594 RepID=A0A839Q8M6_MYCIR|nr:helix-turn-helix transcriptional regulator [Mycolicibacterium iranicum]MBB2988961.1 transcriptional regulator with XRE-family HTH domain [Mycolicibacterium iranicum]